MSTFKYSEVVAAWENRLAIYIKYRITNETQCVRYVNTEEPPSYQMYQTNEFNITKAPRYKLGSIFTAPREFWFDDVGDYLLAQTRASECCLVSMYDGNRIHDPIEVEIIDNSVSEYDLSRMIFPKTTIDMYRYR